MQSPSLPSASSVPPTSKVASGTHADYGRSRIVLFLVIAAGGCVLDLWTKHAVFAWRGLPDAQEIWWLIPGYVGIQTALNTGAVFGTLSGWTSLFSLLSLGALGFVAYWLFIAGAAKDLWQTVALACITAGILGNLHDRLGLWAPADLPNYLPRLAVRDWILLCYGQWVWPNFNLADSFLVCSTAVLMWRSWSVPETHAAMGPPALGSIAGVTSPPSPDQPA